MGKKIPEHAEYDNIQEFNKLTTDNFAQRLKQAKLVFKDCIANFKGKLININKELLQIKKDMQKLKRN